MRVVTMFMGLLLVAAGVWAFCCSGVAFIALAFPIGLVLVLDGAVEAIVYMIARGENRKDNNIWMLADSGLTLFLGIMIICGFLTVESAVTYVFGMWMLASGMTRLSIALNINAKEKKKNFFWTVATGGICAIAGVLGFMTESVLPVATCEVIGIFMIIQAVNTLELAFHMPHVKNIDKED